MVGPLEIVFAAETLIPPAGGAERFWLELAAGLAKRHRVRAFAFATPAAAPPPAAAAPGGLEWT
ncbi:MAG: hypothetical protein M3340_19215, partial [Actinomycetota bacterium]|nr:hypothetical protein [Actinomycetota bacterium]